MMTYVFCNPFVRSYMAANVTPVKAFTVGNKFIT